MSSSVKGRMHEEGWNFDGIVGAQLEIAIGLVCSSLTTIPSEINHEIVTIKIDHEIQKRHQD